MNNRSYLLFLLGLLLLITVSLGYDEDETTPLIQTTTPNLSISPNQVVGESSTSQDEIIEVVIDILPQDSLTAEKACSADVDTCVLCLEDLDSLPRDLKEFVQSFKNGSSSSNDVFYFHLPKACYKKGSVTQTLYGTLRTLKGEFAELSRLEASQLCHRSHSACAKSYLVDHLYSSCPICRGSLDVEALKAQNIRLPNVIANHIDLFERGAVRTRHFVGRGHMMNEILAPNPVHICYIVACLMSVSIGALFILSLAHDPAYGA